MNSAAGDGPLLVCEDLRVDVDGVPACDGLTLRTTKEHVLVLGAPRALFDAIIGTTPVARGTLRLRGVDPIAAIKERIVAGAPFEPPLPPRWTLREYVVWSARLAGLATADATKSADDAIAKLQLGALAKTPLARANPWHVRRAVVVAAALATGASILVLEDPLAGLPEEVAQSFARILVTGLEGHPWIVLAPRLPLTSPLAMQAEEAIVVSTASVDAQGPPAEIAGTERRFRARIHGPVEGLVRELTQRGATIQVDGAHVLLDLGENLTTSELAALCVSADVAVVDLVPIASALS